MKFLNTLKFFMRGGESVSLFPVEVDIEAGEEAIDYFKPLVKKTLRYKTDYMGKWVWESRDDLSQFLMFREELPSNQQIFFVNIV